MTVKAFSWTGFFSHLAVYVAVHPFLETNDKELIFHYTTDLSLMEM
jgi:hypothetical protein